MNVTDEIVELTKKLIEFESIASKTEQLKNVIDFVENYLSKNTELKIKRFESGGKPSLVGIFGSKKKNSGKDHPFSKDDPFKTPLVFFHDHLDVVPGNPEQFVPVLKGDKLYGRGASDTKTNGAALMVLARELSTINKQLTTSAGFMFTTDEEIGGHDGAKYLLDRGYRCKFFVTCEPSRLDIVTSHKGVLWVKIKVAGKASHASRPWDGVNASLKAYEGLNRLYKLYPLPKKEAWKTTVNVGGISGGDAFNRVMSDCELKLDIRFIEKDDPEIIIRNIKKCFPESEIEIVEKEAGMNTDPNDLWVKRLASSIKRIAGRNPELKKGHGACDGRFYSAAGIPAVEFGTPAHGLHTDEEYVYINSLEKYYKILWDFVSGL